MRSDQPIAPGGKNLANGWFGYIFVSSMLHLSVFSYFLLSATSPKTMIEPQIIEMEIMSTAQFEALSVNQEQVLADLSQELSAQLTEIPAPIIPTLKPKPEKPAVEKPKADPPKNDPKPKTEKPKPVTKKPSNETTSSQDANKPNSGSTKPAVSNKPSSNNSADLSKLRANFGGAVHRAFMGSLRAPRNIEGVRAVVELVFANGKLGSIRLKKSSGNAEFDNEVIRAAKQARYPKAPKELAGKMSFEIPVNIK